MIKKIKVSAHIFAIYFIINLIPETNIGQDRPVIFERVTSRDGLSQNNVYSITQDHKGFIWIGTEDGLNRYDGYQFTVYKNKTSDTLSLSDNFVNICYVTSSGDLWLGTEFGGLNRFNSSNDDFSVWKRNPTDANSICSNFIDAISEDRQGNLWIASPDNGFDYFDVNSETFIHYKQMLPDGYEINRQGISALYSDDTGRLWVGGTEKLHLFRINYRDNSNPVLVPLNLFNGTVVPGAAMIKEDPLGNIWIGTSQNGLFKFDHDKQVLIEVRPKGLEIELKDYPLTDFTFAKDGSIWIGGLSNLGLLQFNPGDGVWKRYQHDPLNPKSLGSDNIFSLFVDRTGVLWAGTQIAGFNLYDPTVVKFMHYQIDPGLAPELAMNSIRGFHLDRESRLWVAIGLGGLVILDRKTGKMEHYSHDPTNPKTLSSNLLMCIYQDTDSTIWIGTRNGLNRFNPIKGEFRRFYFSAPDASDRVNAINYNIIEIPAKPGYLWFGTNGGLVRFHKESLEFKTHTFAHEHENSNNNRDNTVRTVFYSPSRPTEIWLGTTRGIRIYDIDSESFRYYAHDPKNPHSLSNDNVMHLHEDEEGIIWIATYGGGLNRLDPQTGKFQNFTIHNSGLPNDAVYSVIEDHNGHLWLSTNNGLSRFNKKTGQFRNYTVDDGLQSEEFNGSSHYQAADGEIFFGGINGFNSFYPQSVVDNMFVPKIAITNLKIFNQPLVVGKNSPLLKHITETEEIILAHWQNDLIFEFVALHFARSAKNQYAFQLENYDHDWRYVGHRRDATYTHMDPGEYIFRVKASNSDGIWDDQGKSLRLIIRSPWWKTKWAYLSYGLLFIMIIFTTDRIQRRRLIRIEQEKLKLTLLEADNKRKSEELEEARQLQLSMLPKLLPKVPHLDIAVYMQTATEVGGDYYDFHVSLDGTFTVVVGDATGHGMKAGTMVTATKSLFSTLGSNPDILFTFKEMTRCFKLLDLQHLSMCMTMLKIKGNKMIMSSAGMPPAFIFNRKKRKVEEHMLQGMPLGTMDKFPYQVLDNQLNPGDTILLLSDGLPELLNEKGELYGYKRVGKVFEEVAERGPDEIINRLKDESLTWIDGKSPDDDVTFVVLRVK